MRFTFTLVLCLLVGTSAWAQINSDSPFPVLFRITAPAAIAGTYDYGTQTRNDVMPENWGPTLSEDLSGEVVWAYDAPGGELPDSLVCEGPALGDVAGKIALIRRGSCDFSAKVYNAQQGGAIAVIITNHYDNPDDTPETLVGMLGGDNFDLVTIPAIFVSRNTGELIDAQLAAGETVTVLFDVRAMYEPYVVWSYHTPLDEFVPHPGMRVNFANIESDDEVDVTVTATITAPNGVETVFTGNSIVAPDADSVIIVDGEFMPDTIGTHTVTFTNNQNDEVLETAFEITEFTYALDSNDETPFAVGPGEADFANALRYDAGALIVTDEDGAMARFASFGLGNAAELVAAARGAELPPLLITLYDADGDNDGQLDFTDPNAGANTDFSELSAVAFAEYVITGDEGENEMIYVELEDLLTGESPITLEPNEFYYLVLSYDDTFTGIGVAPTYTSSAAVDYLLFRVGGTALPVTPIITSQFFNGGWAGRTVALRLHLDGFVPPPDTNLDDLEILDADRVTIAPNPVGDQLNVLFKLEGLAGETQLGIFGADGRQYGLHRFESIANAPVQLDVKDLAAGTYFLSIFTPEGYRLEKFIKL
ncbi:MAG: T9SS C-terminal target domain-containing protein [Bacteroidetes bacterium]|nr:MAG: T9SS C-terminal target domain-containing protein [Bacteroidota bacterium]